MAAAHAVKAGGALDASPSPDWYVMGAPDTVSSRVARRVDRDRAPAMKNMANHDTIWRIIVSPRGTAEDVHARQALVEMHHAGMGHIRAVGMQRLFFLLGNLEERDVTTIAERLLTDPVTEHYETQRLPPTGSIKHLGAGQRCADQRGAIEIHYRPGVMDPVALSTAAAANELLRAAGRSPGHAVQQVRTARRYFIDGARDAGDLDRIARQVLANDCLETIYITGFGRAECCNDVFPQPKQTAPQVRTVAVRGLDGDALADLSRRGQLFLSVAEMATIRDHFATLGREPTDLELETLAQTWSEHCVHKTLKSDIEYHGADFGRDGEVTLRFDNLLASTIARATHTLDRDWCLSVFTDNAGVIAFDDEYGIAFKVETHNHPSALDPYGGAATGVGGCVRDIMGCGLGAKPIANTDVFCLADPGYEHAKLPQGVPHPRRVLKGVVAGVRDYGNRMGIPTVNGAIYFDDRYLANPLVFCGCVGLIPRDRVNKAPRPGDRIVLIGGRTGRDGIHGATFSSAELTDTHVDEFAHAVQIGNAIEEKKVLDALLAARDHSAGCLFTAVTDCGAGGLSSAVGEMGAELGAVVDLERVPLKYAGLRYDEIWISEAQERMVFAVPPDRLDAFLAVCAAEEVEAVDIGAFTDDRRLCVRYDGAVVGDLEMAFLHEGRPTSTRRATWRPTKNDSSAVTPCASADAPGETAELRLLCELRSLNVASKEPVIRQYDHQVQGRSAVKPLCGPGVGPSDAAVLRPRLDSHRGVAIACGLCPHIADDDPYWMAVAAVDEALRNVICVGGDPSRTAILDNFCWGSCADEEMLGALVRACRGAHDAAVALGLPFISGKDSLNNEFSMNADEARRVGLPERIVIPHTLLISAVSIVEDVRRCVTMDLKRAGSTLVLVAPGSDACAASGASDDPPGPFSYRVTPDAALPVHETVASRIRAGRVRAAHDVSDGGLAVALAEMCIAGRMGARIDLDAFDKRCDRDIDIERLLFQPGNAVYVLETGPDDTDRNDPNRSSISVIPLGTASNEPRLVITHRGRELVNVAVDNLRAAWQRPLANAMDAYGQAGMILSGICG